MKRIILILLCLLVATIGISYVAAGDIDNQTIKGPDAAPNVEIENSPVENINKTIKIDIEDYKLENNPKFKTPDLTQPLTYNDLKNDIDNIKPGSILTLNRDYQYSGSSDKYITIDKSITIDGKGHYIDGAGKAQIFKCTSANIIVLKNIVLKNARNEGLFKYYAGGAIYNEKADFKVINCKLLNNVAGKGAAIYSERPITIEGCKFEKNWVKNYGGAVYCEGDLILKDSEFSYNTAKTEDGGAIYCDGNVYVKGGRIGWNTAFVDGGGIYCSGKATLENMILDRNRAEGANSKCFGGAIRAKGGCDIYSCAFGANYAEDYGGAVYSDKEVNIKGVTKFKANEAKRNGGGIYSKGTIKINWDEKNPDETLFDSNDAKIYSGGGIYSEEEVYVNKGKFSWNWANIDGAGIYGKEKVYVLHCNFEENHASTGMNMILALDTHISTYGGAIKSEKSVSIDESIFYFNLADYGGAVYAGGEATIKDSEFGRNSANHHGGAVYAKTIKEVSGSAFTNNKVKGQGGAIYVQNKCSVKLISTTFKNNEAEKEGGAIFLNRRGTEADISYCVFVENKAGKGGQDVYNCGHYKQIQHNWHGTNNPDFKDSFKIYNPIGSDTSYNVENYLVLNAKLNTTDFHVNNVYTLSTYFTSNSGKFVQQDLIKYTRWDRQYHFEGAEYKFREYIGRSAYTIYVRENITGNEYSIDFKLTNRNPVIKIKMDNEMLTLNCEVKD